MVGLNISSFVMTTLLIETQESGKLGFNKYFLHTAEQQLLARIHCESHERGTLRDFRIRILLIGIDEIISDMIFSFDYESILIPFESVCHSQSSPVVNSNLLSSN